MGRTDQGDGRLLVMEGTVTLADRAASPYLYLPFQVPEGTRRISLRYTYDEGNVLDIGLVDPEIEPFPARRGFRGWSGAARRELFVSREAATPGYVPGPIQPGAWKVILGLHQVKPQGCRYRVEVLLDGPEPAGSNSGTRSAVEAPGAPGRPSRGAGPVPRPLSPETGWYRGDLHAHTFHSDARGSLEDLAASARARGLDFLAVTDHNTASHHPFLEQLQEPGFLLIPGEEVTTDRGHANVWGVPGWVDFRLLEDADVERLVQEVHARGGVISVNHPKEGGPPWTYPIPREIDCLEAWQMLWPFHNRQALDLYDSLLREGRRISLVGGSDWHQPAGAEALPDPWLQVGSPTTWLHLAELTVPAILDALRRGAAFVSEGPDGPALALKVGEARMGEETHRAPGAALVLEATVWGARGDRLRWVGSQGILREVPVDSDPFEDRWLLEASTSFVRLEVVWAGEAEALARGFERIRALSNPVYVREIL